MGPIRERDMKAYLKKAQEQLAQEKLAAQTNADAEDQHAGLLRTKKTTGREVLEGTMPIMPISAIPLNVVSATMSANDPPDTSTIKKMLNRLLGSHLPRKGRLMKVKWCAMTCWPNLTAKGT